MNPGNDVSTNAALATAGGSARAARTVPPKLRWIDRSPSVFFGGMLLAMLMAGLGAVVYFFDPTHNSFYPQCTFHQWTGLNCPGCGATRAVYALLHGRWQTAWRDNALFLLTGLALFIRVVIMGIQRWRRQAVMTLIPVWSLIPWMILAVIFGVLRNLPAFAFLSPLP